MEIVDSAEKAAGLALEPLLIRRPLERFLDEHGRGTGPIDVSRRVEGTRNIATRIDSEAARVVLRRPPRPTAAAAGARRAPRGVSLGLEAA